MRTEIRDALIASTPQLHRAGETGALVPAARAIERLLPGLIQHEHLLRHWRADDRTSSSFDVDDATDVTLEYLAAPRPVSPPLDEIAEWDSFPDGGSLGQELRASRTWALVDGMAAFVQATLVIHLGAVAPDGGVWFDATEGEREALHWNELRAAWAFRERGEYEQWLRDNPRPIRYKVRATLTLDAYSADEDHIGHRVIPDGRPLLFNSVIDARVDAECAAQYDFAQTLPIVETALGKVDAHTFNPWALQAV